jgi:hypothetical protein
MTVANKVSSSQASRCSGTTANTAAPAANTAAVATLAAVAGSLNVTGGISGSLSATPSAAVPITLSDGATVIWQNYVTAGGAWQFPFTVPVANLAVDTALVLTLAAGGSGVSGTANFDSAWTETP